MKKILVLLLSICLLPAANAQTVLPLTDHMEIPSNSNIRIEPGSYDFADMGRDGVIRIMNKENIIIDGTDVEVTGVAFTGFLFNIENSRNITIRNFHKVEKYFYALSAKQSTDIHVLDNNFSYNKKDTSGWISIYTGVGEALGGGVLFDRCTDSEISGNLMTQQNDGVALYECDNITVNDNIVNWNCGFGIRMTTTNNCSIHHNDCSHVNRITDPSDCAAILLITCSNNRVEHNNLTYSGDGVFLSDFRNTQTQGNNFFGYNDCSYSPHNAIEATFSDGNQFVGNKCNFSHYGFWLGYSHNCLISDNEIIGNLQSGIAIDRGYRNSFINNHISLSPYGIELWEGSGIDPYTDQFSHHYSISDNIIEGNVWGISAINTEDLVVKNNAFSHNKEDIYIEGQATHDTITGNLFRSPTLYHLRSTSSDEVFAPNNTFIPMIDTLIRLRISGNIEWQPFIRTQDPAIQWIPPCDMAERPGVWTIYADPGYGHRRDETLEWDYADRKVGAASVKLYTPRGWDVGLNYRPGDDSLAVWSLQEDDTLTFWLKTIKQPSYGFQAFHIRLGNTNQGYFEYTAPASLLNNAHNNWRRYRVPIQGNMSFVRSTVGNMSLENVNYVEFRADTWDYGYTLWVDGVQFHECTPTGITDNPITSKLESGCFPNPFDHSTTVWFNLPESGQVLLAVYDLQGRLMRNLIHEWLPAGNHEVTLQEGKLHPGIYFYKLTTTQGSSIGKMIKN